MISYPLLKYVLVAALRDKLIGTLVLLVLLGASVSLFMGAASVTEEQAFSVVLASGGLRFLGVLVLVLFISFYIRKAFEHKEVDFLLSRPIGRSGFLLTHALAFSVLSTVVGLAITVAVAVIGNPPTEGLVRWSTSIVIEFVIMANAALFFSMALHSAAGSALASLGLYVLARMIGVLLGIAMHDVEGPLYTVLGKIMEIVSIIIPRLDYMGQTTCLVYGVDQTVNLWMVVGQGVVFVAVLLAAASIDLARREF